MKIHKNPIEEAFTAKSKASGRVVNFASQQNRDNAIKSGEYEETDVAGEEPAPTKPKVNIFDKPKQQAQPTSDDGGEAKPPMAAKPVVKKSVDILKSKVEKWSDKEKAFFRDGIHKQDSPERRNWKDAIKDKAKGAIAAIKKGAKHEVEEFKTAGGAVKSLFDGKKLDDHQKKALKAVAIKVATTALFGAATGGAGHGALVFGKHVAMEFIPHVVGETILKGVGTAALFAGEEEEDIYMERFMAIIADKMANEKITPELMTQMVDSYNAKKGEEVTNEEISQLTPDQNEMVNGIIEMLLQIKDIDNRMEVAQQQIQNFKDEGIEFNYAGFLSSAGLDNNDEPIMMNTKTMPQHILNKESIMNEEFKHLIHVDTPTQVVSKPVAAQIMALAKKGVRSKDIGLEMGFVGNAKLAADTFQTVKNKIYFELGKKFEAVNVKVDGTEPESSEETLEGLKKMAMGDLERIADYANMISERMNGGQDLSAWMYSQITLAVDQLNSVHDAMDGKDGVVESVNEGLLDIIPYFKKKKEAAEKKQADILKRRQEMAYNNVKQVYDTTISKLQDPKYSQDKDAKIKACNDLIWTVVSGAPKNEKLNWAGLKTSYDWDELNEFGMMDEIESSFGEILKVKTNKTESMDEAKKMIQPKDDWGVRLVQAINNNVSALHTSVVREKRDINQAVEAFGTMLKNAIKETLKHKYKPNAKAKDADTKIKTFISELKKFENIVNMVIAKPTKIGVTKLDDAWRSIWNHKFGGEIALSGELFNSLIEGKVNEVKYPTDLKVGSVIQGQGFTRLKGIDGGKYYKIVDMDDTTATLTRTDPSGKVSSPTKVRHKLDSIEAGIKTAKRGDENGIVVIKESILKEDVYKTILYDNKHKMFFGLVDDETRDVKFIDAKTWLKSTIKDKASDNSKEEVLKSMVRKISQFNRKVEFNMWVNKEKPTWEQKMKYLLDKGLAANVNRGGIRVYESVNESTPGEQIQNLNNRLTKLRQDMAAAKSPEAKNVIQAKMKNALQKLSDKKKELGVKKP